MMLKELLLSASAQPALRAAARWMFRLPGVGPSLRQWTHSVLPPGRTWLQLPEGPGKGIWMNIDPYWEEGYVRGCAEVDVLEAIVSHLSPGSCFYDIGAHIGFYSLIAARVVGPQGCVLAVEPDPDNVSVLRDHIARNAFTHIQVVEAAATSYEGKIQFHRSGSDAPTHMSGKVGHGSSPPGGSTVVETAAVSLDGLARAHPAPAVVKIDVEGEEVAVLEGAPELLHKLKPVLVVEVHSAENWATIEKLLSGAGYRAEKLGAQQLQFPARFLARPLCP
jgi:FkbM family methyltransferase